MESPTIQLPNDDVGEGPTGSTRARSMRVSGVALVLLGTSILTFFAWQYLGTNWVAQRQHAELRRSLEADWATSGSVGDATNDVLVKGEAFALVRIPRFGRDYEVPLIDGVDDSDLASGIGWFPNTARPGQVGNFAIAAHRITHGEPFRGFLELRKGDEVEVETRTHIYTYRLSEPGDERVLDFSETWILDPVPGKPDEVPTRHLLTMVTCAELFHTDKRNVAVGELQTVRLRTQDQP